MVGMLKVKTDLAFRIIDHGMSVLEETSNIHTKPFDFTEEKIEAKRGFIICLQDTQTVNGRAVIFIYIF